eukprot:g19685.t1
MAAIEAEEAEDHIVETDFSAPHLRSTLLPNAHTTALVESQLQLLDEAQQSSSCTAREPVEAHVEEELPIPMDMPSPRRNVGKKSRTIVTTDIATKFYARSARRILAIEEELASDWRQGIFRTGSAAKLVHEFHARCVADRVAHFSMAAGVQVKKDWLLQFRARFGLVPPEPVDEETEEARRKARGEGLLRP